MNQLKVYRLNDVDNLITECVEIVFEKLISVHIRKTPQQRVSTNPIKNKK